MKREAFITLVRAIRSLRDNPPDFFHDAHHEAIAAVDERLHSAGDIAQLSDAQMQELATGYFHMCCRSGKTPLQLAIMDRIIAFNPSARFMHVTTNERLSREFIEDELPKFAPNITRRMERDDRFLGRMRYADQSEAGQINFTTHEAMRQGVAAYAAEIAQTDFNPNAKFPEKLRPEEFNPDAYDYIFVDEAHQMQTYKRKPEVLKFKGILAFTATPHYGEAKNLMRMLGHEYYRLLIPDAMNLGIYKDEIHSYVVRTKLGIDLDSVKIMAGSGGDYQAKSLTEAIDVERRNLIIPHIYRTFNDPRTGEPIFGRTAIVYCSKISHANALVEMLNEQFTADELGVEQVAAAWHERSTDGPDVVENARQGKYGFVVMVGKFNGINIPNAAVEFLADPTLSPVKQEQRASRVLTKDRNNPQNSTAYIFELVDDSSLARYPVTFAHIAGDSYLRRPGWPPTHDRDSRKPTEPYEVSLAHVPRLEYDDFDIVVSSQEMLHMARASEAARASRGHNKPFQPYVDLPEEWMDRFPHTDHPKGWLNKQQMQQLLGIEKANFTPDIWPQIKEKFDLYWQEHFEATQERPTFYMHSGSYEVDYAAGRIGYSEPRNMDISEIKEGELYMSPSRALSLYFDVSFEVQTEEQNPLPFPPSVPVMPKGYVTVNEIFEATGVQEGNTHHYDPVIPGIEFATGTENGFSFDDLANYKLTDLQLKNKRIKTAYTNEGHWTVYKAQDVTGFYVTTADHSFIAPCVDERILPLEIVEKIHAKRAENAEHYCDIPEHELGFRPEPIGEDAGPCRRGLALYGAQATSKALEARAKTENNQASDKHKISASILRLHGYYIPEKENKYRPVSFDAKSSVGLNHHWNTLEANMWVLGKWSKGCLGINGDPLPDEEEAIIEKAYTRTVSDLLDSDKNAHQRTQITFYDYDKHRFERHEVKLTQGFIYQKNGRVYIHSSLRTHLILEMRKLLKEEGLDPELVRLRNHMKPNLPDGYVTAAAVKQALESMSNKVFERVFHQANDRIAVGPSSGSFSITAFADEQYSSNYMEQMLADFPQDQAFGHFAVEKDGDLNIVSAIREEYLPDELRARIKAQQQYSKAIYNHPYMVRGITLPERILKNPPSLEEIEAGAPLLMTHQEFREAITNGMEDRPSYNLAPLDELFDALTNPHTLTSERLKELAPDGIKMVDYSGAVPRIVPAHSYLNIQEHVGEVRGKPALSVHLLFEALTKIRMDLPQEVWNKLPKAITENLPQAPDTEDERWIGRNEYRAALIGTKYYRDRDEGEELLFQVSGRSGPQRMSQYYKFPATKFHSCTWDFNELDIPDTAVFTNGEQDIENPSDHFGYFITADGNMYPAIKLNMFPKEAQEKIMRLRAFRENPTKAFDGLEVIPSSSYNNMEDLGEAGSKAIRAEQTSPPPVRRRKQKIARRGRRHSGRSEIVLGPWQPRTDGSAHSVTETTTAARMRRR